MATIDDINTMQNQYILFKNSLTNAQQSLKAVITAGTVIYNSSLFAAQFPSSIAAYKTYLASAQTAINTLLNNFPTEPSLNG